MARSGHTGTYRLDIAAKPKVIDIVLKSPSGEDWKYHGIYEFDGDILKICLVKDGERPTTFEKKELSWLYRLKRVAEGEEGEKKDKN